MTRIAIVTQFPMDPEQPRGGVEGVSVNLVKHIAQHNDFEVIVITINEEISSQTQETWCNATIHRLPRLRSNMLFTTLFDGPKQIKSCLNEIKPDIVHAHDTYGIMVKNIETPKVFTIHGFIYGDTLVSEKKFPYLRSKIWKFVEQGGWAKQPNIISISPYVRERLSGITAAQIYDIDNPISSRFFEVIPQREEAVVFSSAVISPRKNTLGVIKSFKHVAERMPNARLRLAGSVSHEEYYNQVKDYVEQNGLSNQVDFLGKISTEDVISELSRAKIYILLSYEENSPLGIEEAMASGVPVITSNRCGMPYMLKHGKSGYLVDCDNHTQVATRILSILEDESLFLFMSDVSKKIAQDRYHPDGVAEMTITTYKDILSQIE